MKESPHRPPPASHPPERAAALRGAYRYAVPRAMIERATERRLAGERRGARASANAGVRPDPEGGRGLIAVGTAPEGVTQGYDLSEKEHFEEAVHAASGSGGGWDGLLEELEEPEED
ncbi:hypothetical protein SUDANB121_03649 [Nocardiopsis dassonvillei]|uniref:hypothetical protein n=1 Tax=Nocardiopsis dassonvillei TaxID=2014 RepID=UPI003F557D68